MGFKQPGEPPERPAKAYQIVADLLPKGYFTMPPPDIGIQLTVTGADGIPTTWFLPGAMASPLHQRLSAHRQIRSVRSAPYDDRDTKRRR